MNNEQLMKRQELWLDKIEGLLITQGQRIPESFSELFAEQTKRDEERYKKVLEIGDKVDILQKKFEELDTAKKILLWVLIALGSLVSSLMAIYAFVHSYITLK
jgi:hypothetical protein